MPAIETRPAGFYGEFPLVVDKSRRLMFPAKWRPEDKSMEFHVIAWPIQKKECLLVLPPERWQRALDKLQGNSLNDRGHAAFEREIARTSAPLALDKVGRLCLPDNLTELAGIDDEALLVGRVNKFEIWSPKRFKATHEADAALAHEFAGRIEL